MRLFVGIPLSEATRAALVTACDALRETNTAWMAEKWVAPQNLHLTLAFLGEVPDESVASLSRAIGDQLAEVRAFDLPLARLSLEPSRRRATMLWAVCHDPEGACAALASAVARAAAGCGIETDDRKFKAHVTLMRLRRPARASAEVLAVLSLAHDGLPGFLSVHSATLFSSTLTKAGPHYETLETWDFPA